MTWFEEFGIGREEKRRELRLREARGDHEAARLAEELRTDARAWEAQAPLDAHAFVAGVEAQLDSAHSLESGTSRSLQLRTRRPSLGLIAAAAACVLAGVAWTLRPFSSTGAPSGASIAQASGAPSQFERAPEVQLFLGQLDGLDDPLRAELDDLERDGTRTLEGFFSAIPQPLRRVIQ